jgi:hypothetical protein
VASVGVSEFRELMDGHAANPLRKQCRAELQALNDH